MNLFMEQSVRDEIKDNLMVYLHMQRIIMIGGHNNKTLSHWYEQYNLVDEAAARR
jgi:hypothetical protein